MTYTCAEDDSGEDVHPCPPAPVPVLCPEGYECHKGICAKTENLCTDSDLLNDPILMGEVYDSVYAYGKDFCDENNNLIQADCECPDSADSPPCAGGTLKTVMSSAGSPDALAACIPAGDETEPQCPYDFCKNQKILGHMHCPTDECLWNYVTYEPCPEGMMCVEGACVSVNYTEKDDESSGGTTCECDRSDTNGVKPGGGHEISVCSNGVTYDVPKFDKCGLDPYLVKEIHCDGWKAIPCPEGYACFDAITYDTTPATCEPIMKEASCERSDDDPIDDSNNPKVEEIGGGFVTLVDLFEQGKIQEDQCMTSDIVTEFHCLETYQFAPTSKHIYCPDGYKCKKDTGLPAGWR